jgi:hypothetical protein
MLQCCNQFIPLQTIETSVEPDKEYQVENILEKRMISGKPTISSNERGTTPLKTHENSQKTSRVAQEHFSTLRGKVTRLDCQKSFDMLSKAETRSQAEEFPHHHHYCCSFSLTDKEFSV